MSDSTLTNQERGMAALLKATNWSHLPTAQFVINKWADATFPDRHPESSLYKLVLEEIPELLLHLKTKGKEGIDEELADCFILLLDLAHLWHVDVGGAIKLKMMKNMLRTWKHDPSTGFYNHVEDGQ